MVALTTAQDPPNYGPYQMSSGSINMFVSDFNMMGSSGQLRTWYDYPANKERFRFTLEDQDLTFDYFLFFEDVMYSAVYYGDDLVSCTLIDISEVEMPAPSYIADYCEAVGPAFVASQWATEWSCPNFAPTLSFLYTANGPDQLPLRQAIQYADSEGNNMGVGIIDIYNFVEKQPKAEVFVPPSACAAAVGNQTVTARGAYAQHAKMAETLRPRHRF